MDILPVLIDLVGHKNVELNFRKYIPREKIKTIINNPSLWEAKIILKFLFKSNNNEYLKSFRHSSETEPLDIYTFNSK